MVYTHIKKMRDNTNTILLFIPPIIGAIITSIYHDAWYLMILVLPYSIAWVIAIFLTVYIIDLFIEPSIIDEELTSKIIKEFEIDKRRWKKSSKEEKVKFLEYYKRRINLKSKIIEEQINIERENTKSKNELLNFNNNIAHHRTYIKNKIEKEWKNLSLECKIELIGLEEKRILEIEERKKIQLKKQLDYISKSIEKYNEEKRLKEEQILFKQEVDRKEAEEQAKKEIIEKEITNKNNNSTITNQNNYILFFDTETTGLPKSWKAPINDFDNWPRLVQLAYILFDYNGNKLLEGNHIIKPHGFRIPEESSKIHKITNDIALSTGIDLLEALSIFESLLQKAKYIVAHNIEFDEKILLCEFARLNLKNSLSHKEKICTMLKTTQFCGIQGPYGLKWPKLSELYQKLFNSTFEEAHNAEVDIKATAKCFWELRKRNLI